MPGLALEPFSEAHLDPAAELLAARHARHRRTEPLLSERFEDPAVAREQIEALFRTEGASGAVAIRDGRVVGYLVGMRKDDSWGPNNVWVEAAGHAAQDAETVRDLYGAAATRWVDEGRTRHYALVPATDEALVQAWFRVGFGQQHAHGIREVTPTAWPVGARPAEQRDVDGMVEVAPTLGEHQLLSPVFSEAAPTETPEELRMEILDDLANESIGNVVAEVNGRIIGNFVVVPVEMSNAHTGLARPDGAAHLGYAATLPDVRGSGAGLALTQAALAWAFDRGYPMMVTDWRVTNLLSSRFWPKRGFRETFLRLYRSIP
jgi:GNAT superfamily N-acetyltransferase